MLEQDLTARESELQQVNYVVYHPTEHAVEFLHPLGRGKLEVSLKWDGDGRYKLGREEDITTLIEVLERVTGSRFESDHDFMHEDMVRYARVRQAS